MSDNVKSFLIPGAVWLGFILYTSVLLFTGERSFYGIDGMLFQWDGEHYLSIARDGYQYYPCGTRDGFQCGNVGWFPFFPMVASLIAQLGIDHRIAVLATSWLSFLFALVLIYRLVERHYNGQIALYSIIALVLFPTSFYFLAAFPYSLFLLLVAWIFNLMYQRRYALIVPLSACLAVTYPSGIMICLPLAYTLFRDWKVLQKRDRILIFSSFVSAGLALLLYFGYYWLEFDNFFLFTDFQSQRHYAHHLTFPLIPVIESLRVLPASHPVYIFILFSAVITFLFFTNRVSKSWLLFAAGILLFTPTFGTTDCYYRHVIVAFPLFVMIGMAMESPWRKYVLAIYVVLSMGLSHGVYIHYFKLGQLM